MTNNDMTNLSNIERTVMRRVRVIRLLRPIVSLGAFSALVCAAALWGIGREVWVARVFENMPAAGLSAQYHFWLAAFINTEISVMLLIALALVSVVYLARTTARAFVAGVVQERLTLG